MIDRNADYVILQMWLLEGRMGGISPDQTVDVASRTSLHSSCVAHHVAADMSNSPVPTGLTDTVPHGELILLRLLQQTNVVAWLWQIHLRVEARRV
jgi:hypothetical protein